MNEHCHNVHITWFTGLQVCHEGVLSIYILMAAKLAYYLPRYVIMVFTPI